MEASSLRHPWPPVRRPTSATAPTATLPRRRSCPQARRPGRRGTPLKRERGRRANTASTSIASTGTAATTRGAGMVERPLRNEETMSSIESRSPAAALGKARLSLLAAMMLMLLSALATFAPDGAEGKAEIIKAYMVPTDSQAGGHPDVRIFAEFKHRLFPPPAECKCDDARLLISHFPTGFTGNPHAVAKCSFSEFVTGQCPSDSQVGVVTGVYPLIPEAYVPVYNMETHPDQAGLTAFIAPVVNAAVMVELSARTESDYGLDAAAEPIFHLLPIGQVDIQLWGVPALPSH